MPDHSQRHSLENPLLPPDVISKLQNRTMEMVNSIAPSVVSANDVDYEVWESFRSGEFSYIRFPAKISAAFLFEILKISLGRVLDPLNAQEVHHALWGHDEEVVRRASELVLQAIRSNTAEYLVQILFVEIESKQLRFPRLVISAPTEKGTRYRPLYQEVGELLLRQYLKEDGNVNFQMKRNVVKQIWQHVSNFGINFGIMVAIFAGLDTKDIYEMFNSREKEIKDKLGCKVNPKIHAGLIDGVRKILIKNVYTYRGTFDEELHQKGIQMLTQNRDLNCYCPSPEALGSFSLGNFSSVPLVVLPSLAEMVYRYAPEDFLDPARERFALKEDHLRVFGSNPITTYESVSRLPFTPEQLSDKRFLTSPSVEAVKEFLRAGKGELEG